MAIAALIIEGELLLTELTALASQFHIKSDAHDILRYETAAIRAALCVLQRHQSDLEASTSESQLADATRAQTASTNFVSTRIVSARKRGGKPKSAARGANYR
ncbi:MAG: hypothetical protein ACRDDD_12890 [Plesiomonas sp.]|uniref:hypothetical protein n=1 Tax=Plesiomonas sp. TaxID=2486279 RepID=UPI003EE46696